MKTLIFTLFLIFALNTKIPSATAEFVTDTDDRLLINGGTYYILPSFRGMGGGLGLTTTGTETCPLTVAQDPNEASHGLPVRIASPYLINNIYEGLILDLSFTATPSCVPEPSRWTIAKEMPRGWSVKVAGYEGAMNGWFTIQRYRDDYKLMFCPRDSPSCSNLGIYMGEDGNRRLVVNEGNPMAVMFKKVDTSAI
ncbi:hypothetical protein L6164_037112 [Bauhinia variegata]|uniref:Uncharacterized protein n=1 Tax=Bauhinia variegata TaxID=167791 RepID=A0ACB9KJ70_BAUVA|nr:hypothetical protein L6164_037112 [Bauhinia variegata]